MTLVKPKNYIVTARYFMNGKTNVDGIRFEKSEHRDSPSEALELAKLWSTPNIELSLSRTISFDKGNGSMSEQNPIHEDITFGQLEEFASEGENLPKKQFYVPMTIEEARFEEEAIRCFTGKPVEYVLVR